MRGLGRKAREGQLSRLCSVGRLVHTEAGRCRVGGRVTIMLALPPGRRSSLEWSKNESYNSNSKRCFLVNFEQKNCCKEEAEKLSVFSTESRRYLEEPRRSFQQEQMKTE